MTKTMRAKENRVDNQVFRERLEHLKQTEGLSSRIVAERLDFGAYGSRRVDRLLGLAPSSSHGRAFTQRTVSYALAVRLCEALGMDPVDAGI